MWRNLVIRVMGKISEIRSPTSNSDNLKHIVSGRVEKPFKISNLTIAKNEGELSDVVVRERKPKNIRYAIMLAYQGKNYYGMQVN